MIKKYFLSILLIISIAVNVFAQDTKPVKLSFQVARVNDSTLKLSVNAALAKGVALFSVNKQKADAAFISTMMVDTPFVLKTTDSCIEKGKAQLSNDANGVAIGKIYHDSVQFQFLVYFPASAKANLNGSFTWLAQNGDQYLSDTEKFSLKVPAAANENGETSTSDQSLWKVFLVCFITGLIAIITPCVFPLIPVTVSFFLKRSKSRVQGLRNAVWYSLSIISIYTIPTLLLTLVFGDKILYNISTSATSNILFFVIFIVFAISFFGAFELELPNSWANKADQQAGKGGLGGIFFMALTLVIVSFSCTGPLVGTLLGQTSSKGVSIAPVIGMLGFGTGLALPFSLFAFFPSMLHSLPKSGGWLNSVKVTFGFIELALAMKFLSNVDLAYHWHLLDRDVFLVLWIVIFALMGLYLLGKLTFSHDSELKFISVPRLFFAIFSFSFATYMVPGLFGAPLKLLSGFIPPASTQEFNLQDLKYRFDQLQVSGMASDNKQNSAAIPPKKYIDKLHVPFGLVAYFDLAEGMAAAKALNKPVMLDFTGHSCANCRKMEEQVWKNPEVLKRIKENFVLVSLYVDESTELPTEEQITNAKGEKIITVGDRNLEYEVTKFGFNAQPLYMFLDHAGNPLDDFKYGYDGDVQKFIDHLDKVYAAFGKQAKH